MAKYLTSFSNENVGIEFIEYHYKTAAKALVEFYNPNNQYFVGYQASELDAEFNKSYRELELNYCLSLLSSVEAAARIDYLVCTANRFKDSVSQALRNIFNEKENRASLEDDILEAWKVSGNCKKNTISNLKSATNYRHWLAHGRYWVPKLGRVYDFDILYTISKDFIDHMKMYRNNLKQNIG